MFDEETDSPFERRKEQAARDLPVLTGQMCRMSERVRSHGMFLDGSQVGDLLAYYRALMECHDAAVLVKASGAVAFLAEALGRGPDHVEMLLLQAENYLGVRRLSVFAEMAGTDEGEDDDWDSERATVASLIQDLVEGERRARRGEEDAPGIPEGIDATVEFFETLVDAADWDMPVALEQSFKVIASLTDDELEPGDLGAGAVAAVHEWLSVCWGSLSGAKEGSAEYRSDLGYEGHVRGWPAEWDAAIRRSIARHLSR